MTLILDSGALIALERSDRAMWVRLKASLLEENVPVTHGGVIGQVWRGARTRQSLLAKGLRGIDVRALDDNLGRLAGELLARSRSRNVAAAALVLLAADGDDVVTSDGSDIAPLARVAGRQVELIAV